jgi:hypothetical protein
VLDRLVVRRPRPHGDRSQEEDASRRCELAANIGFVEAFTDHRERRLDRGVPAAFRLGPRTARRGRRGPRKAHGLLDPREREQRSAARWREVTRSLLRPPRNVRDKLERDALRRKPHITRTAPACGIAEHRVLETGEVRALLGESQPGRKRADPGRRCGVGDCSLESDRCLRMKEREVMQELRRTLAKHLRIEEPNEPSDIAGQRRGDGVRAPRYLSQLCDEPSRPRMEPTRPRSPDQEGVQCLHERLILQPLEQDLVLDPPAGARRSASESSRSGRSSNPRHVGSV